MGNPNQQVYRIHPGARHRARRRALQLLYAWQISPEIDRNRLQQDFVCSQEMHKVDMDYFQTLISGIWEHLTEIDSRLSDVLQEMSLEEINLVERAILRIATYELCIARQLPKAVVLNEAIVLAKTFGSSEGHRLVNSILDFLDLSEPPSKPLSSAI